MTRLQKILLTLIALELVGLGLVWRWHSSPGQVPAVDWNACMIEDAVASEIRGLENHLQSNNPTSWAELAATYRAFGLFPQAEYCYRQVDRLSPRDRTYLYHWAECFALMGQTKAATKRYRQIIEEKLSTPLGAQTAQFCWLNIGQDFLREENVPAASEALRKARDIPKAKFLLARVLLRSGRAAEANVLLDELLHESPDTIEFNQMKSWTEAALGDEQAAQRHYEKSLRSPQSMPKWDPTYQQVQRRRKSMGSQAWHEKSLELEAQGKPDEARQWSRKAVQGFWAEDRLQQLARLELKTGHAREAIALAEDCVRRVGASAATLDIMGVATYQLGDRVKAQQVWEQAAQIEPTPNLYFKLAELQRLARNDEKTRQYQALEQYQSGKEAWLKNDLKAAREHFEKAVRLADRHAHSWYYLAETRRLQGDVLGAEIAYHRCLANNPDHGRALRGLERLQQGIK